MLTRQSSGMRLQRQYDDGDKNDDDNDDYSDGECDHDHGEAGHAHSHAPGQSDVEMQIRMLASSGKLGQQQPAGAGGRSGSRPGAGGSRPGAGGARSGVNNNRRDTGKNRFF